MDRNSLAVRVTMRGANRIIWKEKTRAVYLAARSSSRSIASERSRLRWQKFNHNSANSDNFHSSVRRRLAALEYSIIIFSPRLLTLTKRPDNSSSRSPTMRRICASRVRSGRPPNCGLRRCLPMRSSRNMPSGVNTTRNTSGPASISVLLPENLCQAIRTTFLTAAFGVRVGTRRVANAK